MTAQNDDELFEIEDAFERSFQWLLAQSIIVGSVYRSRETGDMEAPFTEVRFLVGEVNGHKRTLIDGSHAYDSWTGSTLEFSVTTHRIDNGTHHKHMLAAIRRVCQYYQVKRTWAETTGAQFHAISDIRESGTTYVLDSENNLDISTITFNLTHNIRPDAWPSNL